MAKPIYDPSDDILAAVAKFGGEVVDRSKIRALMTWDIRLEPSRNARNIRMTTVTLRFHSTQIIAVFPERAAFYAMPELGDLIRETAFD